MKIELYKVTPKFAINILKVAFEIAILIIDMLPVN